MSWDDAYIRKGTLRKPDPLPDQQVDWCWYGVGALMALVGLAYLGVWLIEGLGHV